MRLTFFLPFRLPTVQFDGPEWDRSSSPTERLRPPGLRSSPLAGGGMKFRMPQEGLTMVGERVDPSLPLEKQVYVFLKLIGHTETSLSPYLGHTAVALYSD